MNLQTLAISLLFFSLFFIDGPGDDAVRSLDAFWDLGHTVVFALWSYLLIKWIRPLSGLKFLKQAAVLLVFAVIVGASIELLQGRFHRTPSVSDLFRDIIGALVAIAFLARQRKDIPNKLVRTFQAAATLLVIGALFPLAAAVTDEYAARKSFPVLSNLESPFELSRWECETGCSIAKGVAPNGGGALEVPLKTTLYSGASLKYFHRDWRGYAFLTFNLFNELDAPLRITCRIHDKWHEDRGNKYSDRYNVNLTLNPGWNNIRIPLSDVASAPKERRMDMAGIRSIGFFVTRLKKEMNIYVDDLAIVK